MRLPIAAALLASFALAGCFGPEGNPNGQAYANETGGTIATQPQFVGNESYDPYGKPAPFADMTIGSAALSPTATPPLDLSTKGAAPTPKGSIPKPQQH
jgi:hypothetical protein